MRFSFLQSVVYACLTQNMNTQTTHYRHVDKIQTCISNLVLTPRFWNNFHRAR